MSFEGAEKRLEITFSLSSRHPCGLRILSRLQLDELMSLACCSIISSASTDRFDGYVLSESSLFVLEDKWILKTCGRTQLLRSVQRLLEFAKAKDMKPIKIKYSRTSFLFPEDQVQNTNFAFREILFFSEILLFLKIFCFF